jgi:hypothetical protein
MNAFRAADYDAAYAFATERFRLRPALTNPDLVHDMYLSAIPTAAVLGRLDEARQLAHELDDFVQGLTPHHRVHGAAIELEIAELAGDWAAITADEDRALRIVGANRHTPCIWNARTFLVCALASEATGRSRRARELEAEALEYTNESFGATLAAPRARLALIRGALELVEELLADEEWLQRQTWFALPAAAARLDAFAVLGSPEEVEDAAARLSRPATYLEPFAQRARGIAGGDDRLLSRANEGFGALSLDWHAAQTDQLRRLRKLALG